MAEAPYKLTERDLDLILLEELSSDTGFLAWFVKHLGLVNCTFLDARHFVWKRTGKKWRETDVQVFVESGGSKIAILIEDKIAAQFTDRQAERYKESAEELVKEGDAYKSFIVLCAPESYLAKVPEDDPWDLRISLETVLEWFESVSGFRASWRAKALRSCLECLSASQSAGSEEIRRFSSELRDYLISLGDEFDHNETGDNWGFIINSPRTPTNVEIAWKNNQACVDLTFYRDHVGKASADDAPPDVTFMAANEKREKSDIFRVKVPAVDVTRPLEEQMDIVSEVMDAVHKLLPLVDLTIGSSD
ncbi:MAG: PD-(D/E)XK nuclease family protein [Rhodospirillaceae bacterium]|nr:PD-(D/E)XK nuclease family protein [Rhodospirillaceae bacterium]